MRIGIMIIDWVECEKKSVLACLKVLSWYAPESTEETQKRFSTRIILIVSWM
jgi:hypothetical protein